MAQAWPNGAAPLCHVDIEVQVVVFLEPLAPFVETLGRPKRILAYLGFFTAEDIGNQLK